MFKGHGLKTNRTHNKGAGRITIRQCKYLNKRVEGDYRFIKWRTQFMLGFKNFESAKQMRKHSKPPKKVCYCNNSKNRINESQVLWGTRFNTNMW